MTPEIVINHNGAKSLKRAHPWIFSGAVVRAPKGVAPGQTVSVVSAMGQWLAKGAYSPASQIRVRIWTFDARTTIDADFIHQRLAAAIALRDRLPRKRDTNARRLVNGESDGLPGLIVDQYGDYVVCQFLAAGVERWREEIVLSLSRLTPAKGIYERSDADVRAKEGLARRCGVLWGEPPPEYIRTWWGDVAMEVDVVNGHKTGHYLDQCENQARVTAYARNVEVLNCFSYTGGFGLWALKGGAAHVTQVDASESALDLGRRNLVLNGLDENQADHVAGNVFEFLRKCRDSRSKFDLIILDPPKFVASKGQLHKGCRGYKDINLLAFKLLRPGGVLFTFSCSGLVTPPLFQKIVADAALDAGRRASIIGRLHARADHPVALNFPEGEYLKGFICGVSGD